MTFPRFAFLAPGGVAAILLPLLAWAAPPQHKLLVTFDYNFADARPCKDNETGTCVKQFIIYDITDPKVPAKLFSIAVNPEVKNINYRVRVESNLLQLSDGKHTFAATAQLANGRESDPNLCTTKASVRSQQVELDLNMERRGGR